MRSASSNASALASSFLLPVALVTTLAACLGSEPEATGTLAVNLVAQAPSGAVYRLRDATIVVQGPTALRYWHTEDDPDRTSLSAEVVAGDYSSTLAAGWRLERVEGMSTMTVPAVLTSENPTLFAVVEQQRTHVPLRFRVFGEELDLSEGYEIVLEVEECAAKELACGDGLDEDCDGATDCADTDCAGSPACASICGDGVVEGSEECDDGNTASLDGCSSSCLAELEELEPNDDGSVSTGGIGIEGNDFATEHADANGAFTGDVTLIGHLVPAGDEDVFAFENPALIMLTVRIDLWSSALGIGVPCGPGAIGTGLVIRDASGAILAQNDDRNGAYDRCSGLAFPLAPGQRVYAQVTDFNDNNEIPNYVLVATFSELCGDGTVDPGEQCDDGNHDGGDGCSALCELEDELELEPNNTLPDATASARQITGSTNLAGTFTPGDIDLFRMTVTTPTVVRVDTYASRFHDCAVPIGVQLLDHAGATLASSSPSVGLCGAAALYLETGTYFVRVTSPAVSDPPASYRLEVQYQESTGAEAEPPGTSGGNDTIATASTNLLSGGDVYVFGDHMLDTDVDVYAIHVPPGGRVRAEIVEGNRAAESCESMGVDSALTLLDDTGAVLAYDDDDGRGYCSLIDGISLPPIDATAGNATGAAKTYYLRVTQSSFAAGQQKQFQYRLQVTIR